MIDLKQIKEDDPLLRNAEKDLNGSEISPMEPPDAYSPPAAHAIEYEDMHPVLQHLMDDHKVLVGHLDSFEAALIRLSQEGITREAHEQLSTFFQTFDEEFLPHNQKEEKLLFPHLQKRLLEIGLHSQGSGRQTAVDMLEDDHIKTMQLAAISFNFWGLASRLPDPTSMAIVMDAAIEQGKALVEVLRLHFFREDTVVFPIAQEHLTSDELDKCFESLPSL